MNLSSILSELHNGNAQLVDIREKAEWQQSRFRCAMHLPLSGLSKGVGIDTLRQLKQMNKQIYLHCRSGVRVKRAQVILAQQGCTEVNILPVSMMQMLESGFQLK